MKNIPLLRFALYDFTCQLKNRSKKYSMWPAYSNGQYLLQFLSIFKKCYRNIRLKSWRNPQKPHRIFLDQMLET